MERALFAPAPTRAERARSTRPGLPLFWRLVVVNLAVVLGGAIASTWLTRWLALSGTFTPLTHALLVLLAVAIASGLTMLVLRETFQPIRGLRAVIGRSNTGDRTARATVTPWADPDIAALAGEMNALWDRMEADQATIREKTAQAELLAARVIGAQEEERRRVARELHDEAGQALTALIIGLERGLAAMPESYAPDLPVQPKQMVADLRDLAVQTLDEVRTLALELRPSVLDDLGLVAALRQYARAVQERTGLSIHVSVSGLDAGERLPATVETALFRIAQEAITNAVRHAQAGSLQLRLRRTTEGATLEVRDDGVGFATSLGSGTAGKDDGGHLGLLGMRERARLLGGTFLAQPVSPRGTLIQVSIPRTGTEAAA